MMIPRFFIAVICLLALTGCTTSSLVRMSLQTPIASRKQSMSNSIITIESVKDSRHIKHADGTTSGAAYRIINLKKWLRSSIENSKINTCFRKKPIKLKVDLQKFYIEDVVTDRVCVIVVKISGHDLKLHPWSHIYRGQSSDINWTNSHSAVNTCFNKAMRQINQSLKKDICKMYR